MEKTQKSWSEEELKLLHEAILDNFTPQETAALFPDRSYNSVNVKRKREAKKIKGDMNSNLQKDVKTYEVSQKIKRLENGYDNAVKIIAEKEQQLHCALSFKPEDVDIYTIKPQSLTKSEATPICLLSDWHIEEEVKKEKVDGVNEYNLKIAKSRVENVFVNFLRLVNMQAKEIDIKTCIVALMGDFISGNIHEELLVSCKLQPMDAIYYAQDLIASGIQYLLDNSNYNFIIPCVVGNHGRITKQIYSSSEQENSLEYMMYKNLQKIFERENNRVKFIIPNSDTCYLDVYGNTYRFIHGHQIKYAGAIGGIHTSAVKKIRLMNEIVNAKHTFFGHFHNYECNKIFTCNGSVIGVNCYSKHGFGYEAPTQAFVLLDKKRGITIKAPIFVD